MQNKKNLIKQIIYRSSHRGSKEMDLLLGNFVKKYINVFDDKDLSDLYELLSIEDEIIYKWYFKKEYNLIIKNNKRNCCCVKLIINILRTSYQNFGGVAERLKALVLKTSNGATHSWVQIPPPPPLKLIFFQHFCNLIICND